MSRPGSEISANTRSAPGFRLSLRDVAVLVLSALVTGWLRQPLGQLALLPAMVVLHFFLFCNVFRVRTRYELVWALTFILNAGTAQLLWGLQPWALLGSQLVITALVIGAELRSPDYHGILHAWLGKRRATELLGRG